MIINNVPKECEAEVRRMAMVAIEYYLKPKISDSKIKEFENNVNAILVANNLPKKYEKCLD